MRSRPVFLLKFFLVFCLLGVLVFYFFRQSKSFLSGPKIKIHEPVAVVVEIDDPFFSLRGEVTNTDFLFINGAKIIPGSSGYFEKSLLLARGYNIIELSAEDKYGRSDIKRLEVVLK